jgi:hypothetical protein
MEASNQQSRVNLILCAVIAILIVALFITPKRCDTKEPEKQTLKTPEIKAEFKAVKPISQKVTRQKASNQNEEFLQDQINELLAQNDSLMQAYNKAPDSVKKKVYEKAIEITSFSHTFDSDTITIDVKGLARGGVQSIKAKYRIKSIKIEAPKIKRHLLGSLEVGNSKSFDAFNVKAGIGYQNRKGAILSASADTDKRFYIGYSFSIFSF